MGSSSTESDIQYVRSLVDKSDTGSFPGSIYLLWALIVLPGFGLIDFAPRATGLFWMIAGPGGGLLSWFLGHRAGLRIGQLDREEGIRHALHWGGMMFLVVLAVALAGFGYIQGRVLSQVILLVISFGWWAAGVHFDRNFLLLGGVMMAGFVATLLEVPYTWSGMGILVSGTLLLIALRKGRNDAGQAR